MADREKVINCLTDIEQIMIVRQEICPREELQYWIELQEGVADALALLKEQEAKQIVRKQCKKEHDDGSIDYFAEWYCPHCNMLILRGFDNPSIKFCYKCGKPILWEGR